MYQESDYNKVKTTLTRFVAGYATLSVLVLAGIVTCLIVRSLIPIYVMAGVFTLLSVFAWGMFGGRLVSYRRFLQDMHTGRESTAQGVLASTEDQDTTKEGVEFRALRLLVGDETDKQGGRLIYVDSTCLPLPVQIGQSVRVTLYGNYIKDIHALEDK